MQRLAICERTKKQIPLSEGLFVANTETGQWSFISKDAPEKSNDYDIAIDKLVMNPDKFVEWVSHLYDKKWFKAEPFIKFIATIEFAIPF